MTVRVHQLGMVAGVVAVAAGLAMGATWPMKQRDMQHTGRADYSVPADRENDSFFDVILWQQPSPGSPNEGGFSSSSMVFFDGAGPRGADVVVAGYHWPKGVQGMDRHTGAVFWYGLPAGGETIGASTPAFASDGATVYVVNDATESAEWPGGHPLMGFPTDVGPSHYRHNGADAEPSHLSMHSPTIGPDGRIFLHSWVDRPYAGADNGSLIAETWAAESWADCGLSDPSLYMDGDRLLVVIGARYGAIKAYDGGTGQELWTAYVGGTVDSSVTIDPATGNIYVGVGSSDIFVAGLTKDGQPLWYGMEVAPVFWYEPGVTNPQRAQATGCLSHDGATYYFQTLSQAGDGALYAINTADGAVKWSYPTGSTGWEFMPSSPIVTQDGIVVVGNNDGGIYYAIRDDGDHGTLLDTLVVGPGGNARASATLSPDGVLYLPVRTVWSAGNGDGEAPNFAVENLYTAFDLRSGAASLLWPPSGQRATALNHAVVLSWEAIPDPTGQFDHYAVYRAVSAFVSVDGMTPIGIVTDRLTTTYTDATALNGVGYYYAVTTVSRGGGEVKDVASLGPRTPRDETDLQVVSISRTPRYPRYAPEYTYYSITEPSGFGPYIFSAATGLGMGQTPQTQRWPNPGDPVTYTATVRNRGTNRWTGSLSATWRVDGVVAASPSQAADLAPGQTATFTHVRPWDGQLHDIEFALTVADARASNNAQAISTKSVAFLSYIDRTRMEAFREETPGYPQAATDDFIDWLNRHMLRFNELFAAAGCLKRVHFDVLEVLEDTDPDPDDPPRIQFAIFPFRYRYNEGTLRSSGYYHADEDIDYGLLHEMGHQLGLIDIYQLGVPASANLVSGLGYSPVADLMHGVSPVISKANAYAMNHWLDQAHGYYGQYMYNIPAEMRLRILGFDGRPLPGATVKMYQYCERPGLGKVITNQMKAQGVTDPNGEWVLPNVAIDPAKVPPVYTGDELKANPFGYLAVVGTNGVLHFRVEYGGGVDYAWLDILEANNAYFEGQTQTAVFERVLGLGGPTQKYPPRDMTEQNANDWSAWAEGSAPTATYVEDDTSRKVAGAASLKFVTDGGFDTYVRYPRTFTAQWDLSGVTSLKFSVFAENPNFSFQNGSPWIRLKDAEGNYFEYQYYRDGWPYDLLNEASGRWRSYTIPLNAGPSQTNGWRRTSVGSPSLSRIQYIEVHADTWGYGFRLWLDGVGFDPPPHHPTDFDIDGDADLNDFAHFQACFNGSGRPPGMAGCGDADFEGDGDVDLNDFAVFQLCFNGAGRPVACE